MDSLGLMLWWSPAAKGGCGLAAEPLCLPSEGAGTARRVKIAATCLRRSAAFTFLTSCDQVTGSGPSALQER